jgi:hypothetical protein
MPENEKVSPRLRITRCPQNEEVKKSDGLKSVWNETRRRNVLSEHASSLLPLFAKLLLAVRGVL